MDILLIETILLFHHRHEQYGSMVSMRGMYCYSIFSSITAQLLAVVHLFSLFNSFAGPTFNLLVGLGCGLLTQKESLLSDEGIPISLMPSVQTGFMFLICNCILTLFSGVLHKGVIPKM